MIKIIDWDICVRKDYIKSCYFGSPWLYYRGRDLFVAFLGIHVYLAWEW